MLFRFLVENSQGSLIHMGTIYKNYSRPYVYTYLDNVHKGEKKKALFYFLCLNVYFSTSTYYYEKIFMIFEIDTYVEKYKF